MADTTISTATGGFGAGSTLDNYGYSIEYNHKVTLEYDTQPQNITLVASTNITKVGTTIQDTENMFTGSGTLEKDNLNGATISVFDSSTNTTYSSIITSVSAGTPYSIDVSDENFTNGLST